MRTWLIIVNVLLITAVVFGFDAGVLRKFNEDFGKCNEELGGSSTEIRIDIIKCTLIKDGTILNDNGEYVRESALKKLSDLISDEARVTQAHTMYNKCHDEVTETGATGDEQAVKMITCTLPILNLLDKLE